MIDLGHWITSLVLTPDDSPYGFIYVITNLIDNKRYFGKKQIKTIKKLKPLKGKKNKRHFDAETDWKTYMSSSNELNEDIIQNNDLLNSKEILTQKKINEQVNTNSYNSIVDSIDYLGCINGNCSKIKEQN